MLWNNIKFYNLWYGIHRETVKKGDDEMPSMVEAVPKAKMGLPCTELLKRWLRMTKNVLNCYTVLHILVNVFNFNKSLLMLSRAVFLHNTRNRHS